MFGREAPAGGVTEVPAPERQALPQSYCCTGQEQYRRRTGKDNPCWCRAHPSVGTPPIDSIGPLRIRGARSQCLSAGWRKIRLLTVQALEDASATGSDVWTELLDIFIAGFPHQLQV